jgi:long-chain acyl-CoA synthetase
MFLQDHNKTAFIYDDVHISYRVLMSRVVFYDSLYKIRKGDRVAVLSENRPEWIYAFYSAWKKGGITVPLDFALSVESLTEILKDCSPKVIFCSDKEEETVKKAVKKARLAVKILVFERMAMPTHIEFDDFTIPVSGSMEDLALIMYTSGTTGNPKGVMLTYNNLMASIESLVAMNMLRKNDILIGLLPFYHILPLQGLVVGTCVVGYTVVLVKSLAAEDILKALQKYRVTMFLGVPRLYELFHRGIMTKVNASPVGRVLFALASRIDSLSFSRALFKKVHDSFGGNVHAYLTGGAKMEPRIMDDLWHLGFKMVEGYGSTETAPLIAFNPFEKVKRGSVGIPMAGTSVKIVDDEIVVKGRNVMKGYYNNRRDTDRALRDGWYYTGDTGHIDDEGYLTVTGRKDDIIVLANGENINPEEVELSIMKLSPLVQDIGVTELNGQLAAFVYPNFDMFRKENIINIFETIKVKVIENYNRTAANYRRILHVKIVKDEFPKTRLGKLKRYMLKELLHDKHVRRDYDDEPVFREYAILKKFLREMKGFVPVKTDHLEIDLGLDSLDKVELQTFVERNFGLFLSDEEMASHATVLSMAELIRDGKVRVSNEEFNWGKILLQENTFRLPEGHLRLRGLRSFARLLLHWFFEIRVRGLESIPGNPFILVANHQSYLDVLILLTILPVELLENTYFLMKDNPRRSKILGFLSRGRNIIIVNIDRDLRGSLQKAARVLEKGKNLVIFPEGIRTRTGAMQPFKKLFSILSREFNAPVVPLAIKGAYALMPYGKVLPSRGCIEFIFSEEIYPGKMSYDKLTRKVESHIGAIVEALEGEKIGAKK